MNGGKTNESLDTPTWPELVGTDSVRTTKGVVITRSPLVLVVGLSATATPCRFVASIPFEGAKGKKQRNFLSQGGPGIPTANVSVRPWHSCRKSNTKRLPCTLPSGATGAANVAQRGFAPLMPLARSRRPRSSRRSELGPPCKAVPSTTWTYSCLGVSLSCMWRRNIACPLV